MNSPILIAIVDGVSRSPPESLSRRYRLVLSGGARSFLPLSWDAPEKCKMAAMSHIFHLFALHSLLSSLGSDPWGGWDPLVLIFSSVTNLLRTDAPSAVKGCFFVFPPPPLRGRPSPQRQMASPHSPLLRVFPVATSFSFLFLSDDRSFQPNGVNRYPICARRSPVPSSN